MDYLISDRGRDYLNRTKAFMAEHIEPIEADYHRQLHAADNIWQVLPIIEELKAKAREAGLWNMFLPDAELAPGLSVVDYAAIAEVTGRSLIAPEIFNCNAPDTGNMEVLWKYGTDEQRQRWMTPLLAGEIRSAFCMTEPGVASSDATNMAATAVIEGDEIVINGRKWWSSGIGHPNCEILVFMGLTDPNAPRHSQHSMVLVPKHTPGVTVERMLPVFNEYDAPYGHGEVVFDNVRVPASNMIAGPGRGFEIAQGRLGPGRIHHCMRTIGAAEKALELLCQRATTRIAFGKPLVKLGGNSDVIAEARIAINQARLLTMHAAWMIDNVGVKAAMSEISQIKVVAPRVALKVIDDAIQIHGAAGVSNDFPLATMYGMLRTLRLADGPDEVHKMLVARAELKQYA